MKKGSIIAFLLLIITGVRAQFTQFELSNFDNSPIGRMNIFHGDKLLGTTDTFGHMQIQLIVYPSEIRLERDGRNFNYEIADSTLNIIMNGQSKGRIYKLLVVPDGIEAVLVRATRVGDKEPFARNEVQKSEIDIQNTGRDLPVMLQFQPSVITTSDAGNGVGYTGIRVRGSDASRTNITVNGVPINDAESQGTFWVNMPDFASSVQNVQIQRGVGSSTNGAGAFGATVNMQTASSFKPYGSTSFSHGSYDSKKSTIAAGTGLLGGHWTVDMRLSRIKSEGFIDRAFSELQSYFIGTGYYQKKWSVKFIHFSGTEHTYQAWYGIPTEKMYGTDSALQDHYNRNAGFIYRNASDSLNLFQSDKRTYNYYTYDNETDNYKQGHYHLYFNYDFNTKHNINLTLYRTNGAGYFEQWRPQDALANYGLPNAVFGTDTITTSDIIRRRWLDNTLTGINANYRYTTKQLNFTLGGGYSQYFGNHFGEIVWARTAPAASYLGNYYNSTGDKFDGNIFAKANYLLGKSLTVFADLQARRVYHEGRGLDNDRREVNFRGDFLFFNPKFGVHYDLRKAGSVFGSLAVANKEPSRSDFTDNSGSSEPKPEQLMDMELGWKYRNSKLFATANMYYMVYKNQLVMTGAVNDVGTPLRTNVENSYRAGLELAAAYQVHKKWNLQGNVSYSKNRIGEIVLKTLDYSDYSVKEEVKKDVTISYSPDVVGAIAIAFAPTKTWTILWNHKYVGKQFLDNSGEDVKSLEAYYFSELWVNKKWNFGGSYLEVKLQALNLFNTLYNNNGYTYEYFYGPQKIREVYLFPSAPRNFMAGVTLGF